MNSQQNINICSSGTGNKLYNGISNSNSQYGVCHSEEMDQSKNEDQSEDMNSYTTRLHAVLDHTVDIISHTLDENHCQNVHVLSSFDKEINHGNMENEDTIASPASLEGFLPGQGPTQNGQFNLHVSHGANNSESQMNHRTEALSSRLNSEIAISDDISRAKAHPVKSESQELVENGPQTNHSQTVANEESMVDQNLISSYIPEVMETITPASNVNYSILQQVDRTFHDAKLLIKKTEKFAEKAKSFDSSILQNFHSVIQDKLKQFFSSVKEASQICLDASTNHVPYMQQNVCDDGYSDNSETSPLETTDDIKPDVRILRSNLQSSGKKTIVEVANLDEQSTPKRRGRPKRGPQSAQNTRAKRTRVNYIEDDNEEYGGPDDDNDLDFEPEKDSDLKSNTEELSSVSIKTPAQNKKRYGTKAAAKENELKPAMDTSLSEITSPVSPEKSIVIPKCTECKMPFSSRKDLIDHIKSEHPGTEIYPCEICPKVFNRKTALRKHFTDVHRKKKQCQFCDKGFAYQYELDQHMNMHTGNRPFTCSHCSYSSIKQSRLNAHMRTKHPEVKQTTAKRKSQSESDTEIEEDVKIESEKGYLCIMCNADFCTSEELQGHVQVHDEEEEHMDDQSATSKQVARRSPRKLKIKTTEVGDNSDDGGESDTNDDSALDAFGKEPVESPAQHTCQKCSRSFGFAHLLRRHIQRVHNKKFACSVCDRRFSFPRDLREHERLHTGIKALLCDFCDKPYRTRALLLAHARIQHPKELREMRFECDVCTARFPLTASLENHQHSHKTLHGVMDTFSCRICFKVFSDADKMRQHEEIEHAGESFEPPGSNPAAKTTVQNVKIESEEKEKLNDQSVESNVKMCLKCGAEFQTEAELVAHKAEAHQAETDPKFKCQECGKGYENKETLRNHKRRVHRKIRKCSICNKTFAFQYLLDRHILTHTGERNFVCQICTKTFYSMKELNVHVRLSHNERVFECPECKAKFCTKQSLERHIQHLHTSYRPMRCEFCGKGFVGKRELNAHIFTHTRVSDIKCEKCGKMFGTRSCLNKHMRFVHNGEKKLCPICGKHIVSHLGMHMKSHGEKRFKCDQCPKVYAWPSALKEHIRTHTGEKPYECPVCAKTFVGSANFVKHKKIHQKNSGQKAKPRKAVKSGSVADPLPLPQAVMPLSSNSDAGMAHAYEMIAKQPEAPSVEHMMTSQGQYPQLNEQYMAAYPQYMYQQ